jgi:FHA domain
VAADIAGPAPDLPRRADVSYVPGSLTAVAGDQCLVLVDASPDSPAVSRIWRQLGHGAAPDVLLAALITDGLDGVPGFTLLVGGADGRHRLFCRGTVGATVAAPGTGAATPGHVDGAGLLTWREQVVTNAERIFLGGPPPETALRLPAASGVLLASCLVIDLTGSEERSPVVRLSGGPARGARTNTVVFFPDTITITGPGSVTGQAPARPAAGIQDIPNERVPMVFPAPDAPQEPDAPQDGPGDEGYDFLWGATEARSVADAAVGTEADGGPVSGAFARAGTRPSPQYPVGPPSASGSWPAPAPEPASPPASPPGPVSGLIDAPRWTSGAGDSGAGGAWPEKSAYQPPGATVPEPPADSGFTVKRSDRSALAAAPPPDRIGPTVSALVCPAGHANPPSEGRCRRCGATLPPDPVAVARPVLGALCLSVGDVIALDRNVVMGRSPRADFGGADGEDRPHVVRLPSDDGDISRTHLQVTLDGWHVLVTDLHSTNGTLVALPGRDPESLRPGEPLLIVPGTVVTLAEGISFRYEAAP